MPVPHHSSTLIPTLLVLLGTTSSNLIFVFPSWGQSTADVLTLEEQEAAVIMEAVTTSQHSVSDTHGENGSTPGILPLVNETSPIESASFPSTLSEASLLDQTGDQPSTHAVDLLPQQTPLHPTTPWGVGLAADTTTLTSNLQWDDALAQGTGESTSEPLEHWNSAAVYEISDPNAFRFGLDSGLPDPTSLQGSARRRVVRTPIKTTGLSAIASLTQALGDSSAINLALEGGEHILAFDLGFISVSEDGRRGFGVNFFNQQSYFPAFRGGGDEDDSDDDVELANGETPWVDRLGGGVEFFLPLGDEIDSALGINYQRVAVRDDPFTSNVFSTDEFGNSLTVDNDGVDDYISLNFAARLDNRNDTAFPSEGDILRFGIDQAFKVSDEELAFTRLAANYTTYIPFNFFAFDPGPRTLILNIQAGTMFGDVPPYEGFNLGGQNSVRGYNGGGVGTGTSFLLATIEYRFPIASFELFADDINLRGVLFTDFGTDFGTGDEVIGEPAEVRDKPGDGFGFGIGLQAETAFGLGRLEFAITDEGDTAVIATFGDRF